MKLWVWLAQLNCHLCFIKSQVMTLTLPLCSPDCQYFWALLSRMLSLSVALLWAIVKVCDPKTGTMTFFCEMYIIGLIDFRLNLWFSLPWGSTSCYSLHASLRWTVDIQIPVQTNKIQPHTLRCLTFSLMGASVPSIIVTTWFFSKPFDAFRCTPPSQFTRHSVISHRKLWKLAPQLPLFQSTTLLITLTKRGMRHYNKC